VRPGAPASLALAAALPFLLLHADHQPDVELGVGSTDVALRIADLALLAVVAVAAMRFDPERLRASWPLWGTGAALLAAITVGTLHPLAGDLGYPFAEHAVTAVKFAEYALLAPAAALLVRDRRDLAFLAGAVVLLSCAATVIGVAQYFGLDVFDAWPAGSRQPSFLGHHDFAAFSGAALAVSLALIVFGRETWLQRRTAVAAAVAGGIGLVVSGAVTGALGAVLAGVALAVAGRTCGCLTRSRGLALAAVVGAVCAGVVAMRGESIEQFLRYVHVLPRERTTTEDVQTYAHRTLLAYYGVRIFLDHPVAGAGWQASLDEPVYGPYRDDAEARFPDQPPQAFPSPEHPWGIQNAYLQALADLGVLGFAALAAVIAVALGVGARTALRAPPAAGALALVGLLWLLFAISIWNGIGLVAGLPLDALFWIALGLVAAGRASGHA
jgi:O-antigen ligase